MMSTPGGHRVTALAALTVAILGVSVGQAQVTNTIRVAACIDGRSLLLLQTSNAQWFHIDFAAPGRHEACPSPAPTIINGTPWFPVWPDVPTPRNESCHCNSDVFSGVSPALAQTTSVTLRVVQARWFAGIVQSPDAANNYTLIVEFNDDPPPGPDEYIVEIDFVTPAAATPVPVDIKPRSCPNPLNRTARGVVPVAIVGTADFNVAMVEPASVRLAGVVPGAWHFEDVTTPAMPFIGKRDCLADCTTAGPDGFMDLVFKFDNLAVLAALGDVPGRSCVVVPLTGKLKPEFGGTAIAGEDVVIPSKK